MRVLLIQDTAAHLVEIAYAEIVFQKDVTGEWVCLKHRNGTLGDASWSSVDNVRIALGNPGGLKDWVLEAAAE